MASDYREKLDYSRYKVDGYPVRHKEKVPFYPMLSLSQDVRQMMREIREMDRYLDDLILSGSDYEDLVLDAYASNIHWSTKIEGNRLTMDEVRELTRRYSNGEMKESPKGPVQEILNHLGSMFSQGLFKQPWTMETVVDVHRILMKGVGQTEPGRIREVEVSVTDADGFEYFIPCPAINVTRELCSLVDWANNSPFGEIVTATLFFHEFESIHPFEDGNGRTGRVLFQMLLRELGLKNCELCKFEESLLSDQETYYNLLAYTDKTSNYTPLVTYVTESLLHAYSEALDVFSEKDRLKGMEENSRRIALIAKDVGSFTLQDATAWVSIGESALKKKLDDLVDAGILHKEGKTRAMRYVFSDPFADLRNTSLNDVGLE